MKWQIFLMTLVCLAIWLGTVSCAPAEKRETLAEQIMNLAKAVKLQEQTVRDKSLEIVITELSRSGSAIPVEESARFYFLARAYAESGQSQKADELFWKSFPDPYFLVEWILLKGNFFKPGQGVDTEFMTLNLGGFYRYSYARHTCDGIVSDIVRLKLKPPSPWEGGLRVIEDPLNRNTQQMEAVVDRLMEMHMIDYAKEALRIYDAIALEAHKLGLDARRSEIFTRAAQIAEEEGDWNTAIASYYKLLFISQQPSVVERLRKAKENLRENKQVTPAVPKPDLEKLVTVALMYEEQKMYTEALKIL